MRRVRRSSGRCLLALVLVTTTLPTALGAQADPRLERLKTEALQMVEARSKMAQEIVDMLFGFGELGMRECETQRYLTGILVGEPSDT